MDDNEYAENVDKLWDLMSLTGPELEATLSSGDYLWVIPTSRRFIAELENVEIKALDTDESSDTIE